MRRSSSHALKGIPPGWLRSALAVLAAGVLVAAPALAAPAPPPPPEGQGGPPPPVYHPDPPQPPVYYPDPLPPVYGPVPTRDAAPPPLPIAMRVIYAPFYAAGLILRYGVYYVLVAPFEVLGRTLDYGVDGGVTPDPNGASQ